MFYLHVQPFPPFALAMHLPLLKSLVCRCWAFYVPARPFHFLPDGEAPSSTEVSLPSMGVFAVCATLSLPASRWRCTLCRACPLSADSPSSAYPMQAGPYDSEEELEQMYCAAVQDALPCTWTPGHRTFASRHLTWLQRNVWCSSRTYAALRRTTDVAAAHSSPCGGQRCREGTRK